jgi:hypothetical protein
LSTRKRPLASCASCAAARPRDELRGDAVVAGRGEFLARGHVERAQAEPRPGLVRDDEPAVVGGDEELRTGLDSDLVLHEVIE